MTHLVFGERDLRTRMEDEPLNGWRLNEQRPWLPVVTQIGCGVDGHDTGFPDGGRHIDTAEARVRVVAANECHVQHPRELDIVNKQRAAREQPRVFVSWYPLTEIAWRHDLDIS
jgi:hypothetical protein